MSKKLLPLIILLVWATGVKAQFNFYWAFPYYCDKNMAIQNGNSGILVFTTVKDYNGFPSVEKKTWSAHYTFTYVRNINEIKSKNYAFICVDGTISIENIQKLDASLPSNVIFFIHRSKTAWHDDENILKTILTKRPGWAYGGDPYNPKTPVLRSSKSVFTAQKIILGNQAPGEGISQTSGN
jgi:hypothetical protein